MKKIVQHILTILATLTMVLGSLGSAVTVFADDYPGENDKYDIVLTKVKLSDLTVWPKQTGVDNTAYTGQELTIESYFGTGATTLEGVHFTVYNYDASLALTNEAYINGGTEAAGTFVKGLTGSNGNITFTGLAAGKYVIVENKALSSLPGVEELANSAAVPMKIELPVYKATGGWYTTGNNAVHVYPKNTVDKPKTDKVVNDTDKYDTVQVGELKTFKITSEMPEGVADYKVLTFTDTFTKGLSYAGELTVERTAKSDGTTAAIPTTAYDIFNGDPAVAGQPTVGTKAAKIIIDFKSDYIKSTLKPGDVITIKYKATVNEDAVMGTANPNKLILEYGTNPDVKKKEKPTPPELHTGGKRFEKVDKATSAKLKDAIFQLQTSAGTAINWTDALIKANKIAIEAGRFSTSGTTVTPTSDTVSPEVGQPIYLLSDRNGAFEISGLAYGSAGQAAATAEATKYLLKETKAPDTYALLTEAIEFEVNASSYWKDPTIVEPVSQDPQVVDNNKITIPQTGGIGSVAIVAAGMLVAGLGLMLKRRMAK